MLQNTRLESKLTQAHILVSQKWYIFPVHHVRGLSKCSHHSESLCPK